MWLYAYLCIYGLRYGPESVRMEFWARLNFHSIREPQGTGSISRASILHQNPQSHQAPRTCFGANFGLGMFFANSRACSTALARTKRLQEECAFWGILCVKTDIKASSSGQGVIDQIPPPVSLGMLSNFLPVPATPATPSTLGAVRPWHETHRTVPKNGPRHSAKRGGGTVASRSQTDDRKLNPNQRTPHAGKMHSNLVSPPSLGLHTEQHQLVPSRTRRGISTNDFVGSEGITPGDLLPTDLANPSVRIHLHRS